MERAEQRVLAGDDLLTQSRFFFVFRDRFLKSSQNLFDRRVQPRLHEEPQLLRARHVHTGSRDTGRGAESCTRRRRLLTAANG